VKLLPGFTAKYNVNRLVYYEVADDLASAREREHQIKDGSRRKKMELIDGVNPIWKDLTGELS
jgi:putative endonuclease